MSHPRIHETTRRSFLIGTIAGSSLSPSAAYFQAPNEPPEKALNAARSQASRRRRRIIFNNDGDDIWVPGADTNKRFLAVRHTPLLNTHVDSVFYCTTQSFNRFTHRTDVAEMFLEKAGNFAGNNLRTFLDRDTDGLRMSADFARKNGLESFWTLRMNDIHDAWTPAFVSDWKRQDARRVMSTRDRVSGFQDRRRLWSLVDFEHPDVEPALVSIIEEILRNYPVDGVELDFLRAPIYFRTAYEGKPVTDAQRGLMTRLVRRIRSLVLEESMRQKRPLLLGARVPATIELARTVGLDVTAWMQEKLLDLMSLGGGYITFDLPVREMIEQGHQHGIPVYPCLSQSGLMYRPPRGQSTKQSAEAWFGAASRLWFDGADGIYTFNLFPGPGEEADRKFARRVLTTIGSREKLQSGSIQYAMSDAGSWMPSHYWAKDAAPFKEALPLTLQPNEFTRTYMIVPEDLRGADLNVTAELRVDFTGISEQSRPVILFGSANFGAQSSHRSVADVRRFTCRVPLQAISQGRNRVMVKAADTGAKLVGVELWIQRGNETD